MQKDSIEALHQNRNPLVQEAGLLSLARVFKNLVQDHREGDELMR